MTLDELHRLCSMLDLLALGEPRWAEVIFDRDLVFVPVAPGLIKDGCIRAGDAQAYTQAALLRYLEAFALLALEEPQASRIFLDHMASGKPCSVTCELASLHPGVVAVVDGLKALGFTVTQDKDCAVLNLTPP